MSQSFSSVDALYPRVMLEGRASVTKAAASSEGSTEITLPITKSLTYEAYIIIDGDYRPLEYLTFVDGTQVVEQQAYTNILNGQLRFKYKAYTSALIAQEITHTFYYKVYQLVIA